MSFTCLADQLKVENLYQTIYTQVASRINTIYASDFKVRFVLCVFCSVEVKMRRDIAPKNRVRQCILREEEKFIF